MKNKVLLFCVLLLAACHGKTAATTPPPPPLPPATPPAPAPAISLRANPVTIERGAPVTLQWEAKNAATVRIEPGVGDVGMTGSRDVTPTSSVTYIATATGPDGLSATDTARITVNAPAAPSEQPIVNRITPQPGIDQLFGSNVQTIYFDYDRSEIRSDQMARLQANADWLKQNPNVRFTIEGHCDERGSEEYNLALGDRRANAVKQFMASQGIPETRINVISYGEEHPVCREETEDCMAHNRRAEFVLNAQGGN